jgi:sigma-B regulation protein RsbU (phosphoserine phosphatase)
MFITLLIAVFDGPANRLTYVRAGHVPPFLRRSGGAVERLGAAGGLPLGLMETAAYASAAVDFGPGDELLIVTDGITEAADPSEDPFGDGRVAEWLAVSDLPGPERLPQLLAQVRTFEAGRPPSDDIAAILMKHG